jgi:hypothetical protein
MGSKFESCLLGIDPVDLAKIYFNVIKLLSGLGNEVEHEFKGLELPMYENNGSDRLVQGQVFWDKIEALRTKRMQNYIAYANSKQRRPKSAKLTKSAKDEVKIDKRYYNPDLYYFEACLELFVRKPATTQGKASGAVDTTDDLDRKWETTAVFFSAFPTIGKPALNNLDHYLDSLPRRVDNLIIISSDGLTSAASSITLPELKKIFNVLPILHESIKYDPQDNWLCKKHTVYEGIQRATLLEREDETEESYIKRFPRIFTTDPIAIWKNFRPHQIIRVENLGMAEGFRVVVDPSE